MNLHSKFSIIIRQHFFFSLPPAHVRNIFLCYPHFFNLQNMNLFIIKSEWHGYDECMTQKIIIFHRKRWTGLWMEVLASQFFCCKKWNINFGWRMSKAYSEKLLEWARIRLEIIKIVTISPERVFVLVFCLPLQKSYLHRPIHETFFHLFICLTAKYRR